MNPVSKYEILAEERNHQLNHFYILKDINNLI